MRTVVLFLFALLPATARERGARQELRALELRRPIERELTGAQAHLYRVSLRAGQYVHVDVEQRGIDVVVTLLAPDGAKLADVDSPNGTEGLEPLSVVVAASGTYRISVSALEPGAAQGRYTIMLTDVRMATERDRSRIDATRILLEATTLSSEGTRVSQRAALAKYLQAVPALHAAGDSTEQASTLATVAELYNTFGRPDSALLWWRQSYLLRRELADTAAQGLALNQIGLAHSALRRPDSAMINYRLALLFHRRVGAREHEGSALHNIGAEFSRGGRPDSALAYFRGALALEQSLADTAGMGTTLNAIGNVERDIGQLDSALFHNQQSVAMHRAAKNRTGEGTGLNTIGAIYHSLGRMDSALHYLRRALAIRLDVRDRVGEASTRNNIGSTYDKLDQPDSALASFRLALSVTGELSDRFGESSVLHNIGMMHNRLGRPDSAMVFYSLALTLARANRDRASESAVLYNIGKVHYDAGRTDSAVHFETQALAIARDIGDRRSEAQILAGIGTSHSRRSDWPTTSAYYDSATAVHASIATHSGDEANRLTYAEQQAALYADWARVALARRGEIGATAAALAALAVSERGRAQALLELMRRSAAAPTPRGDLAADGAATLRAAQRSRSAVLSYVIAHDTLIILFAEPGHALTAYKRAVSTESLANMLRVLSRALDTDSRPNTLVALRGGGALEPEAPRESMTTRGAIGAVGALPAGATTLRAISRRLSALLLPPRVSRMDASVREIIIVPNGVLGLIPFSVLPTDTRGTPLGMRFALRYAPSLTVLNEADGRPRLPDGTARALALRSALVVGNPRMPSTSERGVAYALPSLPAAEREAAAVAAMLGRGVLTGAAATESEVRRRLGEAPVVHLATHGYAYADLAQVRYSFAALAADAQHDGFLTVGEVLDDPAITLRAELVVLSACQTGLGLFRYAEGTVGLQRAFLVKGARSVLVSLWRISDEATALLMERFYTHWLRDRDTPAKSEALRRAQNDVRTTRGFASPKFWAAFQLVGAE